MTPSLSPVRCWTMWFCAACFYAFQFILRVSPGVMLNDLMETLNLEGCALGTLVSFYYYGYSFMQIPAGLLLDYFGPRRPLSVACFLCGVGCVFFGFGESLLMLGVGRTLMGIGSAFGVLSCIKIAALWFPPQRLSLFVGLSVFLGTLGATCGGTPLAFLVRTLHWQNTTLMLGSLSLLLVLVIWLVVRDREEKFSSDLPHESILSALFTLLKNPQTWLFGFYGFWMYMPLSGLADLWVVPFIEKSYNVSNTTAAGAMSTFYVGFGIGSPLWSWATSYWKSYRRSMGLTSLLTLGIFSFILYAPVTDFFWVYPFYFGAGFIAAGQVIAFAAISDMNPRHRAATASGVHNMFCMLSGVLAQPAIGFLLDWNRQKATPEGGIMQGVPEYTIPDYQLAFSLLLIGFILALVVMLLIKESFPNESHFKQVTPTS